MNIVAQKLKVAPTAALVLHFSKQMFSKGLAAQYMARLDLDSVQDLVNKVNQVSIHFSDVLLFRKNIIRYIINDILTRHPGRQVCILAAGLDPLGLQIVEQYEQSVATAVYEVDSAHMDEKRRLYEQLISGCSYLHTITADLNNPDQLMLALSKQGFDASKPAIIVFEGIMHYITETEWQKLMHSFSSKQKHNIVIMDYAIPVDDVPIAFKEETRALISLVEHAIQGKFQHYRRERLKNLLNVFNIKEFNTYSIPLVKYSDEYLYRNIQKELTEATMEIATFNI